MDLEIMFLQLIGVLIWVSVMVPALILVSKFLFFQYFSKSTNGNKWRPV